MSHKLIIPPRDDLEAYYNSTKSISKTSKHFNTSNPTVKKWLLHYNIKTFTLTEIIKHDHQMKRVEIPSREDLEFLYQNISIEGIRKIYDISQETFYEWLKHHDIPIKSLSEKVQRIKENKFKERFCLSKEQIEEDYLQTQCMGGLAKKYGCSVTTIKKLFALHDITARFAKSSVGQLEVNEYVRSLGFETILNDRSIIGPLELDIIIPEKKIAIEYCGIYYHSETWGNKDRNYHKRKCDLCTSKGYKLITIFESEWVTKNEIVKSLIGTKLGFNTKIYARNTNFKELTYKEVKHFEEENHLQGTRPGNIYYGLLYHGDLVMCLSVGKSRFNKNYSNELIRMTTKRNTTVVGGISKIIKNAKLIDCITYADKRYGDGAGYGKNGFVQIGVTSPNYFYFHKSDCNKLFSRNKFQKHKIPDMDPKLTEYGNMLQKGYDRIWDCGNVVYHLE